MTWQRSSPKALTPDIDTQVNVQFNFGMKSLRVAGEAFGERCGCKEAPIQARSETDMRGCGRLIAALLIAALASACDDTDLSLPEVDASPYPPFEDYAGTPLAAVRDALGEPDIAGHLGLSASWSSFDLRRQVDFEDFEHWIYAVRCCDPGTPWRVPAVRLRLFFDAKGVLRDWGFFHPRTGERMEVKESLVQARRQLPRCMKLRVITDVLKVGDTEGWQARLLFDGQRYRMEKDGDGEMFTFFVDRPSPFLWPAMYRELTIRNGHVTVGSYSGYGGSSGCGEGK